MRKIRIALILSALLLAQPIFADDMSDNDSRPCAAIAKACVAAGFTRHSENKSFWQDCMRPVLMGQTVTGVTVDSATVKSCRTDKIDKLKKMIQELQNAS